MEPRSDEPEKAGDREAARDVTQDEATWTPTVASGGPGTTPPPVERIIEAMLFIGGPPLSPARAAEVIRGLSPAQFLDVVKTLNAAYLRQGRPYRIEPREQGYVLGLRPRFQSIAEKIHGAVRDTRLSPAAIDVLAVIAYRQPITKKEIDALKGSDTGSLLRLMVRYGLVAVTPPEAGTKTPATYGTTQRFLELLGLRSLDDLPQTRDLQLL